jgi:hypothetical protein
VLTVGSSADGNFAFLTTEATNLVPGDHDTISDIVRVPLSQILEAASIRGGPEADDLAGSVRDDYILGFGGDDTVAASPGSDLVDAGQEPTRSSITSNQENSAARSRQTVRCR